MKKSILLIFIALLAAGCNGSLRTGTYSEDIAMPAYEGSEDSLLLSVSLEYADGSGSFSKAVNQAILSGALDFEGWEGTVEQAAGAYRENLIDEYLTDNSGQEATTWEDRITGTFSGGCRGWKNYVLTYYSYRGGPHGIQTVSPIVFNREGHVVTEEDLFAEGWRGPVSELLRSSVLSSMEKEDPELAGLVEAELIGPNGNFSVNPDGIEWIFQPYEVGPYALGIVSATLSWKQLKPYLK